MVTPLTNYRVRNKLIKAAVARPEASLRALDPVRSLVHIPDKYRVRGGSILLNGGEPYLLLATHHSIPGYDILLGMYINDTTTITRVTKLLHPVTGLPSNKITTKDVIGVPVVREVESDSSESNLSASRETIYLAQEVKVNDKVGGKTVRAVKSISGLYVTECA